MDPLETYLAALRRELHALPLAERHAVLAEVRAHLEESAAALRHGDPALSADEAMLKATAGFGDPSEIGVAYGPSGGVVRKRTGDLLLEVAALTGRAAARTGRAAGRGLRSTLKWTAIAAAGVAAVAVVVVLVLAVAYKDTVEQTLDEAKSVREVYHASGRWTTPDLQTRTEQGRFDVSDRAVRVELDIQVAPVGGCLGITVTAPDGTVAFQNGSGCDQTSFRQAFAQKGAWRVTYTYAAFTGGMDVRAVEYPF